MEDETWIVLLEAAGDTSGEPMSPDMLRRLVAAMACDQIVGRHNPYRYAIQLRLASASPAEALFSATARWADALQCLGFELWPLHRSEVLTPEEFDRDRLGTGRVGAPLPLPAPADEGDDLLRSAFYDSLTGFPTLALFRDRAQGVASRFAVAGRRLAVLVVDIDGFGAVNRDLGYIYGDRVLVELAGRLAQLTESTWPVARLAGDEFLMLVDDSAGGAEGVASRVLEAIRAPVLVKGRSIVLTASVGMAPVDCSSDLDDRLSRAGTAMSVAQEAGGDQWMWYDGRWNDGSVRHDFVAHWVPDRLAYVMLLERAALAANECSSLEEAAAIVLQQVVAHTGWRAGHLWCVDPDRTFLRPSGVWHITGPEPIERFRKLTDGRTLASGEGLAGGVVRTGRSAWRDTLGEEGSWAEQEAAHEARLSSAVAFPVLAGTTVVAVLEFFSAHPVSPDEAFLDVMAAVGAQLGRIFERTQAAGALTRSEERYRMLADSLPALVWASERNAACTFVNRRWQEYTGCAAEDALGDGWLDLVHPDDQDQCLRRYLDAMERREPFEMEYRLRHHDGSYRWILDRACPVYEAGAFAGYVGGGIDVTERHQAEAERREEETRFRSLVEAADVMIVLVGADGSLLDEFLPMSNLGYQPGEERGHLGTEYVHPDDRPMAAAVFRQALVEPGVPVPFDCRVRHADGSWRWLRAIANNMVDRPHVGGIVYSITDITHLKTLATKLQLTQRRLRRTQERLHQLEAELRDGQVSQL